jgi:hypothetical protein
MNPDMAMRKLFGGFGFVLGCGCKDPKAIVVSNARNGIVASPMSSSLKTAAIANCQGLIGYLYWFSHIGEAQYFPEIILSPKIRDLN